MLHSVMHSTVRNVPLRGVSINYLRAIDSRRDKRYVRILMYAIRNIPSLPIFVADRSIDPHGAYVPGDFSSAARKTDLVSSVLSASLNTFFNEPEVRLSTVLPRLRKSLSRRLFALATARLLEIPSMSPRRHSPVGNDLAGGRSTTSTLHAVGTHDLPCRVDVRYATIGRLRADNAPRGNARLIPSTRSNAARSACGSSIYLRGV
jgi:hypothetical protein